MSEELPKHLVFVYGSLKRGFHNHHLMEGADFVCETRTRDPAWLLAQFNSASKPGDFVPGVKAGDGYIVGEVYKVTDEGLAKLDKLEENGTRYQRRKVRFESGDAAWMYIHADAKERPAESRSQIEFDAGSRFYKWTPPNS